MRYYQPDEGRFERRDDIPNEKASLYLYVEGKVFDYKDPSGLRGSSNGWLCIDDNCKCECITNFGMLPEKQSGTMEKVCPNKGGERRGTKTCYPADAVFWNRPGHGKSIIKIRDRGTCTVTCKGEGKYDVNCTMYPSSEYIDPAEDDKTWPGTWKTVPGKCCFK